MTWKKTLLLASTVCLSTQVLAQTAPQDEVVVRAESRIIDERRKIERIEIEMREAESRLAEAARRIGQLSSRQLQVVGSSGWNTTMDFNDRPVLGITIGNDPGDDVVEGVEIIGVSPGGAAAEAGLRSGDVITAVNEEMLSADNAEVANQKLLDFLSGVEEGDTLDVEYLRDGKVSTVEVSPQSILHRVFQFRGPGSDWHVSVPHAPGSSGAPRVDFERFVFMSGAGGWGDMEMVELTEDLGRYFGTDEGFLVVSAPKGENLKLRDGDVIQSIDGREPRSVSHTIRILSSYQSGETLEIKIMRDKRRQTLKIEMPDNRIGRVDELLIPHVESRIRIEPRIVNRPAE